jgi:hypothetical protein
MCTAFLLKMVYGFAQYDVGSVVCFPVIRFVLYLIQTNVVSKVLGNPK